MAGSSPEAERVLQALGDPTRRAIVDRLAERPQSVSALAVPLGVTLTAVSQHLQILEDCGLVRTEKVGRVRSCRLDGAGFAVLERWVRDHRSAWDTRFDRLGALLDPPGE